MYVYVPHDPEVEQRLVQAAQAHGVQLPRRRPDLDAQLAELLSDVQQCEDWERKHQPAINLTRRSDG